MIFGCITESPLCLKVRKIWISDFSLDLGAQHGAKPCLVLGKCITDFVTRLDFGKNLVQLIGKIRPAFALVNSMLLK
jgi:hypothetical protein